MREYKFTYNATKMRNEATRFRLDTDIAPVLLQFMPPHGKGLPPLKEVVCIDKGAYEEMLAIVNEGCAPKRLKKFLGV